MWRLRVLLFGLRLWMHGYDLTLRPARTYSESLGWHNVLYLDVSTAGCELVSYSAALLEYCGVREVINHLQGVQKL